MGLAGLLSAALFRAVPSACPPVLGWQARCDDGAGEPNSLHSYSFYSYSFRNVDVFHIEKYILLESSAVSGGLTHTRAVLGQVVWPQFLSNSCYPSESRL